jgi:hypothetical protein
MDFKPVEPFHSEYFKRKVLELEEYVYNDRALALQTGMNCIKRTQLL